MKLSKHDHILTAYAESAAGPGWANSPIWLIIRSSLDGAIRQECLQPSEQSAQMRSLYMVSQAAHAAMTSAVAATLGKDGRLMMQFPVYEDNPVLVYECLRKLILKGKATSEEIEEFKDIGAKLGIDCADGDE